MAYQPQQWRNGIEGNTPTSARRFNHIEDGVEGADTYARQTRAQVDTNWAQTVPHARRVIAGTGLTGGGNMAADRTLAVQYGTTAGTAAQGNDGRLSDTRNPNPNSVTENTLAQDVRTKVNTAVQSAHYRRAEVMSQAQYQNLGAAIDPNTIYYLYED